VNPVHASAVEDGEGGRTTAAGERLQLGPAGDDDAVRLTVPVKPLIAVTEAVAVALTLTGVMMVEGLSETVKSWTFTVITIE
jgi:hypothetical protein